MTVYVVLAHFGYEGSHVESIWRGKAFARAEADRLNAKLGDDHRECDDDLCYCRYRVIEWKVRP